MKIFDLAYFDELIAAAKSNPRRRQHLNVHQSYEEKCQRLFNAIEPDSYIRPHRHATDPRDELLIAVCGDVAFVTFDDQGCVTDVLHMSSATQGHRGALGVEVPASVWHTVIALGGGCVLLEVKSGPFDPSHAKESAVWAPKEGSKAAQSYFNGLKELVSKHLNVEMDFL
jgi:cupin fold WbuC family metalloprotein